jgi:hypothetical protein
MPAVICGHCRELRKNIVQPVPRHGEKNNLMRNRLTDHEAYPMEAADGDASFEVPEALAPRPVCSSATERRQAALDANNDLRIRLIAGSTE